MINLSTQEVTRECADKALASVLPYIKVLLEQDDLTISSSSSDHDHFHHILNETPGLYNLKLE